MINRRSVLALFAVAGATALILPNVGSANGRVFQTKGIAISGYDPVGYFQNGGPVKGDPAYSSSYDGADWHFSSAAHKAMFDGNPEKYVPAYGGFCAYAVSKGATAPTAPEAWTIHNDRLYLNFSTEVREIWRQDIDANIARADANWPGLQK